MDTCTQNPTKDPDFALCGVRSYYTFLDSTLPADRIGMLARDLGASCVALADTNTLAGAVVFWKATRDAGVQGVVGAELTEPFSQERNLLRRRARSVEGRLRLPEPGVALADEPDELTPGLGGLAEGSGPSPGVSAGRGRTRSQSPQLAVGDRGRRVLAWAMDLQGYAALSHAVSDRMMDWNFDLVGVTARLLETGRVLVVTDCPQVLGGLLQRGVRMVGEDGGAVLYGGVVRGRVNRDRNREVHGLCMGAGLGLIALADACVSCAGEAGRHTLLQAMRRLRTVWDIPEEERVTGDQALCGWKEFERGLMAGLHGVDAGEDGGRRLAGQVMEETVRALGRCRLDLPLGQWKFPRFVGVGEDPVALLRELVDRGLRRRYGTPVPENARQRAQEELTVVERLGFAEYFLLVHRIVSEAHGRGFLTVGRGSGANSILSYALGFTEVCPIRYNLYFERFLNPERSVPPDIDIDFSWRDRDELLEWCFEFFGRDRVALIATVQTLQWRQAIREVARAFGIAPAEADRFTALAETGFVVEEGGRRRCLAKEEPWSSILAHAEGLRDFPRHFSIHCGGILITPGDVRDWVPLARAAKGFTITQMDMYSLEDLGLVKIDLLSNRSLGVLRDGLRLAGESLEKLAGREELEALGEQEELVRKEKTGELSVRQEDGARGEVFRREAQRMKLAGSRRGTSVALAGVLGMMTPELGAGVPARVLGSARLLRQRVLDFEFVTADPATRSLIDLGRTMGCFYIESPGMRALFERLRCRNFEEVVVASSIIRPGVAESGMMSEYIERHQEMRGRAPGELVAGASDRLATGLMPINAHSKPRIVREYLGLEGSTVASDGERGEGGDPAHPVAPARPVTDRHRGARMRPPGKNGRRSSAPIHPRMLEILPETYGVMVYQEDVLRVAHEIAGMSYAEADTLRRAMSGKARSREAMLALEERFVTGASQRGLSVEDGREVWRQIASFAGYSFCKGHSAAFAVLSYQVSYLKAHFPAEFTAALISNQGGFYGPGAYLEEARRWGVEVLPPCVNSSEEECTGRTVAVDPWGLIESFLRPPSAPEPLTDPRIPSVRPPIGWVRIGLNLVSGLRAGTALRIATERHQGGEYRGLEDFLRRSAVLPEEVHRLVDAGALDGLVDWQRQQHPGALRPRLHLEAERLLRRLAGEAGHGDLLSGLGCDGGEVSGLAGRVGTPGGGPPWSMLETCQREAAVLGFMVGAHPLDFITVLPPPRRAGIPLVPGRLIRQFAGRRVRMMGWLVAAKLLNTKTTGAPMKMLTLEDRTDTFEATLFPRVYERYAPRTLTRGPYLVEGTVDVSLGSPVLTVSHLEVLPLCEPEVGVD